MAAVSLASCLMLNSTHTAYAISHPLPLHSLTLLPSSTLHVQAGDLKYMVSFASASAALQWALLVQEAAMYLDYPAAFERVPQVRTGRVVVGGGGVACGCRSRALWFHPYSLTLCCTLC